MKIRNYVLTICLLLPFQLLAKKSYVYDQYNYEVIVFDHLSHGLKIQICSFERIDLIRGVEHFDTSEENIYNCRLMTKSNVLSKKELKAFRHEYNKILKEWIKDNLKRASQVTSALVAPPAAGVAIASGGTASLIAAGFYAGAMLYANGLAFAEGRKSKQSLLKGGGVIEEKGSVVNLPGRPYKDFDNFRESIERAIENATD